MSRDAVEELQTKVAFLERGSHELSEEVYRQRRELDELRARLAALVSRIETGAGGGAESATAHEPPPHY